MNENKIAFICFVTNRALYEISKSYIHSLHVPEGYTIELIAIEDSASIASGYNDGLRKTDAKYKIYWHQDVFIQNENFIKDVINIFKKDNEIGLIGMVGAKAIPSNGIWWEARRRFGKVYDSHTGWLNLLSLDEIENEYEPVQAIDGLIMVTQYDILWREDLFNGEHFYDISQSLEFIKIGYKVVVPKQNEAWCVHDCGIINTSRYEEFRQIFLKEYASYLVG